MPTAPVDPAGFQTTSLAIAAYIMAGGQKLRGIERHPTTGRVVFRFDPEAAKSAQAYEAGALINAKDYYRQLTTLRAMVRDL